MLPFLYVLIGIGLIPVRVKLAVDPFRGGGARIGLRVGFLQLVWPLKGMDLAKTLEWSRIWQGRGLRVGVRAFARVLREHVVLERFWVQGRVGLENAAHTAVAAGGLQTALELLGAWLAGDVGNVRVRVAPAYGAACFAWSVDVAAYARVGMLVHGLAVLGLAHGLRGLRAGAEGVADSSA